MVKSINRFMDMENRPVCQGEGGSGVDREFGIGGCRQLHLEWISRSSCLGSTETNLTRNDEVAGSIPGLSQWVKDLALL